MDKAIKKHYEEWRKSKTLPSIPGTHTDKILIKYKRNISKAKESIFQELPISKTAYNHLEKICAYLFSKDRFSTNNTSGIVIAGYGEDETFPSLVSFFIEAIINNKLKYKQDEEKNYNISVINTAAIIPFAQSEMVATFMEGIDPMLNRILEGYLSELFKKYPENIADSVTKLDSTERERLKNKLIKVGSDILEDFMKEMKGYRDKNHVSPIINAVSALPKDELAAMAESLVNLTSFKRKISMEAETVGGPIDVAVISKGDGFVWIKRKHYFKAELNPYFFASYYREDYNKKKGGENEKR